MTTKEAIGMIAHILETVPLGESECNALRFAMDELKRFEDSLDLGEELTTNVRVYELYAIPKEQDESTQEV